MAIGFDLLNRQVTRRGHCTTHVLRDRQLAANHFRLFFVLPPPPPSKKKHKAPGILTIELRCRGYVRCRAECNPAKRTAVECCRFGSGNLSFFLFFFSTFLLPFKSFAILMPVFVLFFASLCKRSRVFANGGS